MYSLSPPIASATRRRRPARPTDPPTTIGYGRARAGRQPGLTPSASHRSTRPTNMCGPILRRSQVSALLLPARSAPIVSQPLRACAAASQQGPTNPSAGQHQQSVARRVKKVSRENIQVLRLALDRPKTSRLGRRYPLVLAWHASSLTVRHSMQPVLAFPRALRSDKICGCTCPNKKAPFVAIFGRHADTSARRGHWHDDPDE
jgi:hypothetical protein